MMAKLFKAGDYGAQRNVAAFAQRIDQQPAEPAPHPAHPAISEEQQEIAALRRQLELAIECTQDIEKESEKAISEAFENGVAEGLRQAQTTEKERLSLLENAAKEGQAALTAHFDRVELLALNIAQASLEKIIGASEDRTALLQQIIRHHRAKLSSDMIVRIYVSVDDFPDADALSEFSRSLGGVELAHDKKLASGQCRFDLKLGRYDASIDLQWERLRGVLDALMHEDPVL